MKKIPRIFLYLIVILIPCSSYGQEFANIMDLNGGNALAGNQCIVKLKTGDEIRGDIKSTTITNGILTKFTVKTEEGEKKKIKAGDISSLWVKSTVFSSMSAVGGSTLTLDQMSMTSVKNDDREYIIYEDAHTEDNSSAFGLLQLLNPGFDSRIKVYALEIDEGNTTSLEDENAGISRIAITSKPKITYLFIKGDEAMKVKRSNYKSRFAELYSDCPEMVSKYEGEDIKWKDIESHVLTYDKLCR